MEWDAAPIQTKGSAVVLLYVLLALFPWTIATAIFAFGAGRQWGLEFGHMQGYVDGAAYAHTLSSARVVDMNESTNSTSRSNE